MIAKCVLPGIHNSNQFIPKFFIFIPDFNGIFLFMKELFQTGRDYYFADY